MTEADTPEDTEDEANEHKVGRTIVTCSDSYKVYRMTGYPREDNEGHEPTYEVYRTIEGDNKKTSVTPPLLL